MVNKGSVEGDQGYTLGCVGNRKKRVERGTGEADQNGHIDINLKKFVFYA